MWHSKEFLNVSFLHLNNSVLCTWHIWIDALQANKRAKVMFKIVFQQLQQRISSTLRTIYMSHANKLIKVLIYTNCSDSIKFAMISFLESQINFFLLLLWLGRDVNQFSVS